MGETPTPPGRDFHVRPLDNQVRMSFRLRDHDHHGAGALTVRLGRTAAGQSRARPPAEPEDINNRPKLEARPKQTKEVFEMAASRFIEEESGADIARRPRRHNGYYAGDFSQMPLTVPDLRLTFYKTYDRRRDVPLAWQ